jgi:hypothetical protein
MWPNPEELTPRAVSETYRQASNVGMAHCDGAVPGFILREGRVLDGEGSANISLKSFSSTQNFKSPYLFTSRRMWRNEG